MLTPQEVSNRVFPKAVMGGYNMALVDEFLDELTNDYTALYKENATLKAKMKVLVDKVEEYRATEDSMRAALLTAQKMANTMVEEAEQKKNALLADAESAARTKIGTLQSEIETEQQRLEAAKAETAEFIEKLRGLYMQGLGFLDTVPELKVRPAAAPKTSETTDVSAIEAQIMASFAAEKPEESAEPELTDETIVVPTLKPEEKDEPLADADEEENTFVRMLNGAPKLHELKFGRNYRGEDQDE